MSSRRSVRQLLVAVLLGVLVGGGLMAVTPAGAEVSQAVATNWKKIWKKNLRPLADRRYYTKAQSDTKYATKAESAAGDAASNAATDSKLSSYYKKTESDARYAAAGSSYSKTESDAKYAGAGSSYTKAESDGRYRRGTELVRGNTLIVFSATAAGQYGAADISLGSTFSAAPVVHIIPVGGAAPAGCSGTAASPDAAAGHLCIFETFVSGTSVLSACRPSTAVCGGGADPWGTVVYTTSTAAGAAQNFAVWAARPLAVASTALGMKAPSDPSLASGPSGVR